MQEKNYFNFHLDTDAIPGYICYVSRQSQDNAENKRVYQDGEKVVFFCDGPGEIETTYRASDNSLIGTGEDDGHNWGTPEDWDGLIIDPERRKVIDRCFSVIQGGEGRIADRWLDTPIAALGGKTPLELLDTPEGREKVMDILGQMEAGVW